MRTLAALIAEHGVDVHDHLDRDDIVPARRLAVPGRRRGHPPSSRLRWAPSGPRRWDPRGRGEAGRQHAPAARVRRRPRWSPVDRVGLDLGVLTVADGAVGYLAHPEHGYLGIGPGRYMLRRRRDRPARSRMVAD